MYTLFIISMLQQKNPIIHHKKVTYIYNTITPTNQNSTIKQIPEESTSGISVNTCYNLQVNVNNSTFH